MRGLSVTAAAVGHGRILTTDVHPTTRERRSRYDGESRDGLLDRSASSRSRSDTVLTETFILLCAILPHTPAAPVTTRWVDENTSEPPPNHLAHTNPPHRTRTSPRHERAVSSAEHRIAHRSRTARQPRTARRPHPEAVRRVRPPTSSGLLILRSSRRERRHRPTAKTRSSERNGSPPLRSVARVPTVR
jgi:hypothetical protein